VRVAAVGAGVYGCTIAVDLARAGHQVDLYERHRDLLHGATRAQQARLHSGFHYPRSMPTALAAKTDAARFAARFPGAVNRRNAHHYAIAANASLTSPDAYLAFCERLDAGARVVRPPSLVAGVDVCVRVPEAVIDVVALRERLRTELRTAGARLRRDRDTDPDRLDHDLVVMATYGRGWPSPLRFEVCEVAVVGGTDAYAFRSFVVLDGPFACLDPLPDRRGHLLYHVEHSVHTANVGTRPEVPGQLAPLLDKGPVPTRHSRFPAMLAEARRFFPHLGTDVVHAGSLFTVRAVLPDTDATDARPTLIRRDGRIVWVLAGKIDGAVAAAERVVAIAAELEPACSSPS
jgi:glycine/D-amino acid oxidase-like deaminating enzyme